MNQKFLISLLLLLLPLSLYAQGLKDLDYTQIDSFALSIKKKYTDLDQLAWVLTHQYKEDHEKVRIIFRWITNNISYDYDLYDKIVHYRRLKPKQREKFLKKHTPDKILQGAIRKRKTICEGYSLLFAILCRKAGLQVEYIAGYDKQEISKIKGWKHAWNAVKINERWYLLDPTWASGYLKEKEDEKKETDDKQKNKKKRKKKKKKILFVRKLNESYYLTPPYLMIYDHFPDSSRWQLLENTIDKATFKKFPIVGEAFFKYRTTICEADTYTIKVGVGELVNFRFRLSGNIKNIYVVINASKYSQSIDFQKDQNEYYFTKSFSKKGNYLLAFYIDEEHFITQKVVVR